MQTTTSTRGLPSFVVLSVALACSVSCVKETYSEPVGVSTVHSAAAAEDPLSSWNAGPARQAIVDLVARSTSPGSPSLVVEAERVAVFANEGTLWPEHPIPEAAFAAEKMRAKLAESRDRSGHDARHDAYRALLGGAAVEKAAAQGSLELLSVVAEAHAGMTDEAFEAEARGFLARAIHPRFGVSYPSLAYRPMRELLTYLRAHGFSIYLCTGGDQAFARAVAPQTYGVPREHVIGSVLAEQLVFEKGRAVLRRTAEVVSLNDRDQKPINIARYVGRRPLLAVGSVRSGGDVEMLRYAHGRGDSSLALVVDHDDPARELAYAEADGDTLAAAKEHGFVVISMKRDWSRIFDAPRREATSSAK